MGQGFPADEFFNYSIYPKEACPKTEIDFDAGNIIASKFTWRFGDSNSSDCPEISYGYLNAGIYPIELELENGCGYDTLLYDTVKIVNNEYFDGSPSLELSKDTVCPNEPFEMDPSGGYAYYTYIIDEDTIYETSSDLYYRLEFAGPYPISVIITNDCDQDTTLYDTVYVVNSIEIDEVDYDISNSVSCINDRVYFEVDNNFDFIEWDLGDGTTSTDPMPYHIYNSEGEYEVSLTAVNPCGDTATVMTTVTITSSIQPIAENYEVELLEDEVCPNDEVIVAVYPGNVEKVDFGDGTVSTDIEYDDELMIELISHAYSSVGEYEMTVTITNGCGNSITITRQVTVTTELSDVDGEIESDVTEACVDEEITFYGFGGSSHKWIFGDGNMTTEETAFSEVTHTYTNVGEYEVQLIVTNNCGAADTSYFLIDIEDCMNDTTNNPDTTDTPDNISRIFTGQVKLYPNPANEYVNLQTIVSHNQKVHIEIINAVGKRIALHKKVLEYGENNIRLNVADLKPGNYFVSVRSADNVETLFMQIE
ncbi:MAG: PKD domain-containing protein [Bacteroidetes bacterium]|jgi:PKD repeat protein|nr:PKD domain-containing protein [Bacteroidota bacterium]